MIVNGAVQDLSFPGTNQYAEMVDSFTAAVRAGGKLRPPAEDGFAQMKTLDAILAAAKHARG